MNQNTIIKEILQKFKLKEINFDVYIIAETQNHTSAIGDRRVIQADESEFFSKIEFAEIASAIFNVFGFANVFYDEISFIKYIINNNISPDSCIVYNLSRNGKNQGKKSLIPSFCELYGIKYTGSDAFVISLLRNKLMFSDILSKYNVSVPTMKKFCIQTDAPQELIDCFDQKEIIIKNINESASIGLLPECKMTLKRANLDQFMNIAKKVNPVKVLVQEFIDGKEYEVLVLQYKKVYYALPPVEIVLPKGKQFLDSALSNSSNYQFNDVPEYESGILCSAAKKAAEILEIKDYARFDFRIQNGIPYLFDIAGTPYTTRHSSVAHLFKTLNFRYEDIYKTIVACMLSNY